MDRIYKCNPDASYNSDSFQVKFPNIFVNYLLGAVRVEDKRFKDWDHYNNNNKKRSHTQLDSRKQVIAFQDRVITINIKEAQHPLKREKQVIDKSSIMLKISTKSMHRVLV